MVTVEKDVRLLVKKELATVNEDFPLFRQRLRGLGESPGGAGRSGDRALYAGSVCRAAPLE